MKLYRVTMTGADESIRPADLRRLSEEFPFVEWGILLAQRLGTGHGSPRFPSHDWLRQLTQVYHESPVPMQLSAHLCGVWLRDWVLQGNTTWIDILSDSIDIFGRVQLNFHGEPHNPCVMFWGDLSDGVLGKKQIIFQGDGINNALMPAARIIGSDATLLFDGSHGAGVLPDSWPHVCYCEPMPPYGYAGGLGPANLAGQLPKIAKAAGAARVWVDMESRIRSDDNWTFDLGKVRECLEIARPWIVGANQ